MDLQASVDRVERELVRLGEHGLDTPTWCRAADGLLGRVVGFDGSCWHTIDPATVLITSHLTLNLPSRFPLLAANEYLADDVNKFADLAAAPQKVGVLSQATDGQPQRSQRWREMLRPGGFDGELRVSFVDGAGCWGSLILVRDWGRADFDPETMRAIQRLAGALVGGLRRTVVAQRASVEQPVQGPGLVVLDRHGQVESLTPAARHWLDHLGEDPPVLAAVAASAHGSGPARARVRTPTGQWLILHGARLDGDPQGRVSVIIEPPRPADLAPLLVAAYGLSDREQTVTALVLQGRSTRQIARALSISPYTVQEHLTAIFDKVGVRSRGELVGQIFFRHCLPAIPD
ncbi:MAG: LuxR C-terminal-related transcriptional regulator [Actinomycetota bacterium]|jgi:DNA-binding CsgD family transcriptional regulator